MTAPASPFRYFNSSPEVIRLVVMMYVKYPLSLRNLEDLLFERGIDNLPYGPALVEPIWPDVGRRDHAQAQRSFASTPSGGGISTRST